VGAMTIVFPRLEAGHRFHGDGAGANPSVSPWCKRQASATITGRFRTDPAVGRGDRAWAGGLEGPETMESQILKQQLTQAVLDPDKTPDPFESLDHILDVAEEENLLPMLVLETTPALKEPGVDLARYYVLGFSNFRLGVPDAAWAAVLPLAGKLEQGGHWEALALLSGSALGYAPRVEAALYIAKAFENAGFESLDPALLHQAYDNFPDESRLSYLMGEAKAREAARAEGGADSDEGKRLSDEARSYWAEALDGFVALKRQAQVEETLLKIADSEDPEILRHILAALKKMGEQNQWGRMDGSLELALPALRKANLIADLWNMLLKLLPHVPPGVNMRRHLRELATEAFPEVDGILDLLSRSGVLDPEVKVETALKTLEPLLAFAPGYFVLHASWGVGRISLNDGETLILDFPGSSNHRMSVSLARRALTVVPADDLRVLKSQDADALKRRLKEDPAGIAFLGIRQLGGEATAQELKRALLADQVLTASQWPTWWKEVKAAMEQDDRFDLSQAFRQAYRIRKTTDDESLALPTIEPRRGIRPNLNLIRRFLEQHPDETARAARVYTAILQRWARQERTNAEERMAVQLQIHRWQKKIDDEFVDSLRAMLTEKVEAGVFSDVEDQKLIIDVGLSSKDLWKDAAVFALSSRYPELRDRALDRLRQEPDTGRTLLHELMQDPADRPVAALNAVSLCTGRAGHVEPFAPAVWDAATGASILAESSAREPIRKQALSLLGPNTTLVEQMLKTPPTDTQLDRIRMLVRRWRSSERFLQPLLNVMRRAGYEDLVKDLRSERMAKTNQMLISQSEQEHFDYPGHLMTRPTFARLKKEVEHLNYELKTTVAQAIAKARALGDLSENAEFESAKMKQRDYSERIASTAKRLQESRMIEDLSSPPGRVAPGTEVTVEDLNTGILRTFWILGEGDDVLGPEVISYTAPLGRGLLGRQMSDQIRLPGEEGVMHQYAVRAIRPRLPEPVAAGPEETAESPGTGEEDRPVGSSPDGTTG
jgi:transcription elongation factor GreA